MFALPVPIQQPPLHTLSHYAPMRSSPLSTSTSTSTPMFTFQSSSPLSQTNDNQTTPTKPSHYAQRYTTNFSNPLKNTLHRSNTSTSPSARSKRRDAFLNRVKQDRENGRFGNRGEQLVLMEDVAERRRMGEAMRRRGERIMREMGEGMEEEGVDVDESNEADMHALDEYISEEQAMEMALFERVQQDQMQGQGNPQSMDRSSFSDEEYDDIFMDLPDPMTQDQGMDMSSG